MGAVIAKIKGESKSKQSASLFSGEIGDRLHGLFRWGVSEWLFYFQAQCNCIMDGSLLGKKENGGV